MYSKINQFEISDVADERILGMLAAIVHTVTKGLLINVYAFN